MRHCCEVLEDQTDVSQKHWIEIKVIFLIKDVTYDVYYNSEIKSSIQTYTNSWEKNSSK